MKLPYSWLQALVKGLPSPEELGERMTMAGFELEEVSSPGEEIRDVVIGKILKSGPHPNADKLTLNTVTDGSKEYAIVCGASNMKEGDCIALAKTGTILPGNFKIEGRKIRGEKSEGMMCSLRELRLGEDHSGIVTLPADTPLGGRYIDLIGLNEVVFDFNVTPNRPDALSALGLAREAAALCGSTVEMPDCSPVPPDIKPDFVPSVTLEDEELCPRYTALVIKDVKVGASPEWLVKRLEACGVRSVNNVVDATNLVLMELGQPLHAFDLDQLNEQRIVVRRGRAGERLVSIDGDERQLDEEMLVIADAKKPVAIAGVMGGLESEVGNDSTSILLESAFFHPPSIRRTSKRLALPSEASYRFERGVDFEMVIPASYRCARLICELTGGRVAGQMGIADSSNTEHIQSLQERTMSLRFAYCDRLLGQSLDHEEIESIFNSVHLTVENRDSETITVRIPSFRQDITREADLVEEVARCHGFGEFTPTVPKSPVQAPEAQEIDRQMLGSIRRYLTAEGLDEAVTYSFTDVESLKQFSSSELDFECAKATIQNPINTAEATMRTSLLPSLLQCARRNVAHGNSDFGLFEIGRIYPALKDEIDERQTLSAVIVGNPHKNWRDPKSELDFFEIKGLVEEVLQIGSLRRYRLIPGPEWLHPKRGAFVQAGKKPLGFFGELNPALTEQYELTGRVLVLEIDLHSLTTFFRAGTTAYKPFSTFPSIKRDLALLIPLGATAKKVEDCIRQESGDLLEELELFDYYQGKQVADGAVSAGFRMTYRSAEGTLKEGTVDTIVDKILARLEKQLGVDIRS